MCVKYGYIVVKYGHTVVVCVKYGHIVVKFRWEGCGHIGRKWLKALVSFDTAFLNLYIILDLVGSPGSSCAMPFYTFSGYCDISSIVQDSKNESVLENVYTPSNQCEIFF